jgi:hypothetical protein
MTRLVLVHLKWRVDGVVVSETLNSDDSVCAEWPKCCQWFTDYRRVELLYD